MYAGIDTAKSVTRPGLYIPTIKEIASGVQAKRKPAVVVAATHAILLSAAVVSWVKRAFSPHFFLACSVNLLTALYDL